MLIEAFAMMEQLSRFTGHFHMPSRTGRDDDLQSEAANGILSSYAGIASECIRSGKYRMADDYLAKAARYAKDNTPV